MKKILIIVAALLAVAIIVPAVSYARFTLSFQQRLHGKPRKEWKEAAVTDVAHKATNSAWLSNEVATVVAQAKATADQTEQEWFSGNVIVTRSGEWMLYTNICNKSDSRIHDLFIGRGSNGKWYYSTYHFCIRMIVLRMNPELEGQPENLQKFIWAYYLKEFDGHSNDCLQETWNTKLRRRNQAPDNPSSR